MNEMIPHPCHQRPWENRMPLAESLRQPLDRFADHHGLMQHGGLSLEVAEERLLGHALDKALDQASGIGNIEEGGIIAGHRLPRQSRQSPGLCSEWPHGVPSWDSVPRR